MVVVYVECWWVHKNYGVTSTIPGVIQELMFGVLEVHSRSIMTLGAQQIIWFKESHLKGCVCTLSLTSSFGPIRDRSRSQTQSATPPNPYILENSLFPVCI